MSVLSTSLQFLQSPLLPTFTSNHNPMCKNQTKFLCISSVKGGVMVGYKQRQNKVIMAEGRN